MGAQAMTARERMDTMACVIWLEQGGRCATCGRDMGSIDRMELAHLIADTVTNRKIYGKHVINHRRDRAGVCRGGMYKGRSCNDAQNIGGKPGTAAALARSIGAEGMRA